MTEPQDSAFVGKTIVIKQADKLALHWCFEEGFLHGLTFVLIALFCLRKLVIIGVMLNRTVHENVPLVCSELRSEQ